MTYDIHRAAKGEVSQVIRLMLSEVSSDPSGMAELRRNVLQRLVYQYLVAPRLLISQMDTLVATGEEGLLGYLIVQYMGSVAGTFDWAVLPSVPAGEHDDVLADLLDAALDRVEEHGHSSHFFFGLMAKKAKRITPVLKELGFGLLDYQLVQMVSHLPLEEELSMPEDIRIVAQIPARFQEQVPELIALDYPEDPEASPERAADLAADREAAIAIHSPMIGGARLFSLKQGDEAIGFVQRTQWRDELRLLFSLKSELWNTPLERQLVSGLISLLRGGAGRVRLRSFSLAHLATSRPTLETLGLQWEGSPWHRWILDL
jgi:hypothetical protein